MILSPQGVITVEEAVERYGLSRDELEDLANPDSPTYVISLEKGRSFQDGAPSLYCAAMCPTVTE